MISNIVGYLYTNVIYFIGIIRQANGALARVINTMKPPDKQSASGASVDEPDRDISLVDVTFRYGQEDVLHKLTCQIPCQKVTTVIGANGSGKSTMFKLIERLYDPQQGSIRFGDKDAAGYDLHAWRKVFGVVAQGSPLMEGTVRAMMCAPDYLLLDEATSNLDAHSERAVMEALEELMRGRTTVVIAHSLATIRKADHVIALREGRVESSGSPKQILEASGNYLTKVMGRKHPEMV